MFKQMLASNNIDIRLNVDFFKVCVNMNEADIMNALQHKYAQRVCINAVQSVLANHIVVTQKPSSHGELGKYKNILLQYYL